jgi:UDP-glucose 4-epimerase
MPGLLTNVVALVGLLRAAADAGVRRFVFASSNAVIGQSEPPIDELRLPRPSSPYGASKLAGEAYCWAFHESYDLPIVVLRFANVYGPNSLHKGNALHKFIRAALADQPITVFGDGEQTRDFIYVGDICDAIDRALGAPVAGELFQIGTGTETSIRMLLERLEIISGRTLRVTHEPPNIGEIRRSACDITKARTELGFEPRVSLDDGLRMTFGWFKERLKGGAMASVVARAGD